MEKKYLILDPSLFTSTGRLKDALKVLSVLKRISVKIVLPSSLIDSIKALLAGEEPENLYVIYKAWLPFYPKDHIVAIVKHQMIDEEYLDGLRIFFREYSPIAAREYVEDIEQLGERSIRRHMVQKKLGWVIGQIAFELIAVSHRMKACIVGFGRRVYTILSRIGVKISELKSSLKKKVKKHSNVKRTLKIAGYVLTSDAAKILMANLGLPEIPFSRDIGTGLLLVANG